MKHGISRRRFLVTGALSGFIVSAYDALSPANASQTLEKSERNWRYCVSCGALFHQESSAGKCPKNPQGHTAAGFEFRVTYADGRCRSDTEETQSRWRKCTKCLTMYFNGGQQADRRCAGGETHRHDGGKCYYLPVNRLHGPVLNPENKLRQGGWRFCGRCSSLFFDGYLDNKGACPSGGAHAALGDLFVLTHF